MKSKNTLLVTIMTVLFAGHNANGQIGNVCGGTPNPLMNDHEIPLGGYNLNFTEQANTPSQIRVGYNNCSPTTVARFNVLNDIHTVGGFFMSRTSNHPSPQVLGVYASSANSGTNAVAIGVNGDAEAAGGDHAIGVNARAIEQTNVASKHTGVNALAANGTWQSFAVNGDVINSSSPYNYGYQTEIYNSTSTSYNYGLHDWVNTSGSANYGALIDVSGATNNYGIYVSTPIATGNYAGYFNGDVHSTGVVTWSSDKKLKENIKSFTGASQILNKLNPVTFDYKRTGVYERMNLPVGNQYGLIAQDVEKVLPMFVKQTTHPAEHDTLGNEIAPSIDFKAVNYNGLIPILVQGHREQSDEIDSLKNSNIVLQAVKNELQAQVKTLNDRLTQLENCLSGILPKLCEINHIQIEEMPNDRQLQLIKEINVILNDKNNIILNQNVPNPFAEKTTIEYMIPETVGNAQIIFYDNQGKTINTVEISERGKGRLNVYADNLSSGMYSYTLFTDGKIITTKRMMKN